MEKNWKYLTCEVCGKTFYRNMSRIKKRHFCSVECLNKARDDKYKPWTKFWKLTIIWFVEWVKKHHWRVLRCKCECGNEHEVPIWIWGKVFSCWCWRWAKHRMSFSSEYNIRRWMCKRCGLETDRHYKNYGGRWIKVRFKNFEEFYAEMWPRPWPEYTVDRINNDGDYEKWNVRRATMKEQSNNRSTNTICIIDGERHTLQQRSEKLHLDRETIKRRIKNWKINWVLITKNAK